MFIKKSDQMEIPIELISTNPDQPRKVFEDKELMSYVIRSWNSA
jgi:ParB-like chromosome segregation protein Spo0J